MQPVSEFVYRLVFDPSLNHWINQSVHFSSVNWSWMNWSVTWCFSGSVELVDISDRLPGLLREPGRRTWRVSFVEIEQNFTALQTANFYVMFESRALLISVSRSYSNNYVPKFLLSHLGFEIWCICMNLHWSLQLVMKGYLFIYWLNGFYLKAWPTSSVTPCGALVWLHISGLLEMVPLYPTPWWMGPAPYGVFRHGLLQLVCAFVLMPFSGRGLDWWCIHICTALKLLLIDVINILRHLYSISMVQLHYSLLHCIILCELVW